MENKFNTDSNNENEYDDVENNEQDGGENNEQNDVEDNKQVGQQVLATYGSGLATSMLTDEHENNKNIVDFKVGMESITKYYGDEAKDRINNELARIDGIENNSIFNLRKRNELPEGAEKTVNGLRKLGVNADNLTVNEATDALTFVLDESEEANAKKTDLIYNALIKHINGVNSRRDGLSPSFYNPREAARIAELQEKYVDWSRGEVDTEKGFDAERAYYHLLDDGYEDPSGALKRHLEEEELEDLIEEGLVDEKSIYIYGPFTEDDLKDAKVFEEKSWTDITNSRYYDKKGGLINGGLSDLLEQTIQLRVNNLETDLLYDYIASEVLQTRRLPAKELMEASTAISLDVLKVKKGEDEKSEADLKKMRGSIKYISYYLGKIFGRSPEEMKERFGSKSPLKTEFYEEMIKEISMMAESREDYFEKNYKPYLTKMDWHLHNLLKAMAVNKETSSIMDDTLEELD